MSITLPCGRTSCGVVGGVVLVVGFADFVLAGGFVGPVTVK